MVFLSITPSQTSQLTRRRSGAVNSICGAIFWSDSANIWTELVCDTEAVDATAFPAGAAASTTTIQILSSTPFPTSPASAPITPVPTSPTSSSAPASASTSSVSVQPVGSSSSGSGSKGAVIGGAVGGAVGGLALIFGAVLVWYFWRKRSRRDRELQQQQQMGKGDESLKSPQIPLGNAYC